jgi:hypothetical protein
MEEISTKAAKCPTCGKYHLIAAIGTFNTDKDTQKQFIKFMKKGFQIIEVTRQDAVDNFGYCK